MESELPMERLSHLWAEKEKAEADYETASDICDEALRKCDQAASAFDREQDALGGLVPYKDVPTVEAAHALGYYGDEADNITTDVWGGAGPDCCMEPSCKR